MRDDVDWKKLRKEYISGDMSQKKLAQDHGVPEKTVRSRAQREQWGKARAEFRTKVGQKLAGALSEEYFKKINLSAEKLLKDLNRARRDLTKEPVVTTEKGINAEGHEFFRRTVTYVQDKRAGKVSAGELTKLITGLDKLLEIGRKQAGGGEQTVTVVFSSPKDEDLSI